MHGNVWEWVQDYYNSNYEGAPTDGSAASSPYDDWDWRVLRGGAWNNDPRNLRSADRSGYTTENRFNYLGFRVARSF